MTENTKVRTCRSCGCDDEHACLHDLYGPCWWVEEDLCSHCDKGLECDQAGRAERQLIEDMSDEGLGLDDRGPDEFDDFD